VPPVATASFHNFKKIDGEIELKPILDRLTKRPPLDVTFNLLL
jgi:hypothetical protein